MTLPVRPRILILAYPETTASVVYGMYDLFMSAGRDWDYIVRGEAGAGALHAQIVSRDGAPFIACNEVPIAPHHALSDGGRPDVVCVPEVNLLPGTELAPRFTVEIDWLRRCHAEGAIIAAACSGAMLLAQAGLLEGLEATTHWAWCDAMRTRHPGVKVSEQRALVSSGEGQRLIMAGAGVSWLDLALYLVARTVSVDVAMQTARINLID